MCILFMNSVKKYLEESLQKHVRKHFISDRYSVAVNGLNYDGRIRIDIKNDSIMSITQFRAYCVTRKYFYDVPIFGNLNEGYRERLDEMVAEFIKLTLEWRSVQKSIDVVSACYNIYPESAYAFSEWDIDGDLRWFSAYIETLRDESYIAEYKEHVMHEFAKKCVSRKTYATCHNPVVQIASYDAWHRWYVNNNTEYMSDLIGSINGNIETVNKMVTKNWKPRKPGKVTHRL